MSRPRDSRSAASLRSVEGGRAALERELLRAILLDLPSLTELIRRLTTAANTQLKVVPPCRGGPGGTDEQVLRPPSSASAVLRHDG